jgi:hypothetical protein
MKWEFVNGSNKEQFSICLSMIIIIKLIIM